MDAAAGAGGAAGRGAGVRRRGPGLRDAGAAALPGARPGTGVQWGQGRRAPEGSVLEVEENIRRI